MAATSPVALTVAAHGVIAMMAASAFALGQAAARPAEAPSPISAVDGIPVGVEHSAGGVLAAADEYVTVAYDSVERDPARALALIDTVYAPQIRRQAIRGAAGVRTGDPAAMALWAHGGQSVSSIGARRLDYYGHGAAEVTTWNATVLWGPGRPPKQNWVLTQTWLRWSDRRWLVTSMTTVPTHGPVPALTPQSRAANDSAAAFGALTGFETPSYGFPG